MTPVITAVTFWWYYMFLNDISEDFIDSVFGLYMFLNDSWMLLWIASVLICDACEAHVICFVIIVMILWWACDASVICFVIILMIKWWFSFWTNNIRCTRPLCILTSSLWIICKYLYLNYNRCVDKVSNIRSIEYAVIASIMVQI